MYTMKNRLRTTKGTACLLMAFLSSFLFGYANETGSISKDFVENSISRQEKNLEELLEWVESTYEINLSYDTELVKGKSLEIEKNTFPKKNRAKVKELEFALRQALAPLGLSVKRVEKNYYLIQKRQKETRAKRIPEEQPGASSYIANIDPGQVLLAPEKMNSSIQERTITGTITDENGQPMPGASVQVKGASIGAVSDFDGNYTIKAPDNATTLVFTYLGYLSQEIAIAGKSVVDVQLSPDINTLEQIVVVGYGTQRRSDLTSSVVSVSGEDVVEIPVPRIEESLKARVPGLQINTTGGQPGNTLQIRLRGNNSIQGNNNPLIVIDGMIGGDLFYVNPSDIESVEVLKDASATAIYGARGSNGVIIITTKKGKGKTKVNFDMYTGWQTVAKTIDLLDAEGFNQVQSALDPDYVPPPYDADTDWQDEIFEGALMQNYQISFSGGNEETSYLLSSSFFDQDGIIEGSDFERLTLRMNLEQKLSDRITIGNNLSFSRTKNNLIRIGGTSAATILALRAPPVFPITDPATGDFLRFDNEDLNTDLENPARLINQRQDLRTNNYLIGNFYSDVELFEGLTYRLNLGYVVQDLLQQTYEGIELLTPDPGTAEIRSTKRDRILFENTLTYKNTFADKHNLTVLGGFTLQEDNEDEFFMKGVGFSSDDLGFNSIQSANVIGPVETDVSKERITSFLGRLNYNFDSRYLFTAAFRADGASVFAENNKWGYFPSVSAGWNIANEPFMADQNLFSDFKLRASYGEAGSPNIGPYQSLASFRTGQDYSNGESVLFNGVLPGRVANPDLKWETTATLNFGLDLSLFNRRIALTAEYYEKETTDLLYRRPLPDYTGFETQTQNVGKMTNEGMEFSLNTVNTNGAFKWSSNFNIFFNRNEIVEIGDENVDEIIQFNGNSVPQAIRETSILREGETLGAFFGFIFDGIYQTQEEADASGQAGAAPGTVRFRDRDGDGDVDNDDRGIIGDPQPDFVWGFTNNFSYKNFDLNFTLQGSYGGDVFWATKYRLLRPITEDNLLPEVLGAWDGEGTSNTMQAVDQDPGAMSTRYLEDGSYIRLQNIALGYTLPKPVLDNLKMEQLRFYIGAQNLFLISDYPGYDPEVNSRGGTGTVSNENVFLGYDQGSYPGVRTFTFGINATF